MGMKEFQNENELPLWIMEKIKSMTIEERADLL